MRPVVSILLGPEGLWIAISLGGFSRCGEQSTLDPSGQRVPRNTLACDSVSRDSPHISDGLSAGRGRLVALARDSGFLRRLAGGVVHCGQRGRLSRFSKLRIARCARVQSLNRVLAPSAPHSLRCRSDLAEEPLKDEIMVPGASFCGGRRNVRLQDPICPSNNQ